MIGVVPPHYPDDIYQYHGIHHGGGMWFSEGALKLGFTDANDPEQIKMFMNHLKPDGSPVLRQQKNNNKNLYGRIFTADVTVNAMAKGLSEAELKVLAWCFATSMKEAQKAEAPFVKVRTGAGGKNVEVAEILSHAAVHLCARDGNMAIHGHEDRLRGARAASGDTYSLDGQTKTHYLSDRLIQRYQQVHFADLLSRHFDWDVEVRNGKAVVVGVSPALIATCGTRRQAAIDYLTAQGIQPTPQAVAYGIVNTRPPNQKFDLAERVATFNAEFRQVTGLKPGQQLGPNRAYIFGDAASFQPAQRHQQQGTPQMEPQTPALKPGQLLGPNGSFIVGSRSTFQQPQQHPQQPTQQPVQQPQSPEPSQQQQKAGPEIVVLRVGQHLGPNAGFVMGDPSTFGGQQPQQQKGPQAQSQGPQQATWYGFHGRVQPPHAQPAQQPPPQPQPQQGQQQRGPTGNTYTPPPGQQQGQPQPAKPWIIRELYREYFVEPGKVLAAAFKAAYGKKAGVMRVRDVKGFMDDTAKRSRRRGHRAAVRALLAADCHGKGIKFALAVAETGYDNGRKPLLNVPKGTRVVVSRAAQAAMTPEQKTALERRARKNGWKLHYAGLTPQQQQQQAQQAQQNRQQRGGPQCYTGS